MKFTIRLLLVFLPFLLTTTILFAQDGEKGGPKLLRADAEGTHFIVGFMQNEENSSFCAREEGRAPAVQQIRIASRIANTVTVNYPNGTSKLYQLDAMETVLVSLDGEEYECLGEGICHKSVEVVAEQPVNLYCLSNKAYSTDGYLALPVSSWGMRYVTANYSLDYYTPLPQDDPHNCNVEPRRGEFAVIAAEDNTTVTIYPATKTLSGGLAGEPMVKVLAKGDIWQVQDGGTERGMTDLTGSRIVADKPVGLLSGHQRAAIPWELDTKDHLIEMLPPIEGLGTRHIVIPFAERKGGDMMRVIASGEGETTVSVTTGTKLTAHTLKGAGDFVELSVMQPTVVESDKPVLVAHYSQSNQLDLSHDFDPYMIATVPTEQYANASLFQTLPNVVGGGTKEAQFRKHFLTVVFEPQGLATMKLNGERLIDSKNRIAGGEIATSDKIYYWATVLLFEGTSYYLQSHGKFGGYIHGVGELDSYGWPVGAAAGADTLGADRRAPQFTATVVCDSGRYSVLVADSGVADYGLVRIYLDTAGSSNVRADIPIVGNTVPPTATVDVRLIDPRRPGRVGIIAVDALANTDTLYLDLKPTAPEFPQESIEATDLIVNTSYLKPFRISNPHDHPLFLEEAQMASGEAVTLTGLGSGGRIDRMLDPGENYDLTLQLKLPRAGLFRDTLILVANCYTYRIPVALFSASGSVMVANTDFGQVPVDAKRCVEVTITNNGAVDMTIADLQVEGPFSIDPTSVPSLPVELGPGGQLTIRICYSPQEAGEHIGTIWVVTAAGTVSGVLQGIGVDDSSSVSDLTRQSANGVAVTRRGDVLRIESHGLELELREIRLVSLSGESLVPADAEREGASRWRISLPNTLPSGLYYLYAERKDGAPLTTKVLIVR